jgi:hypothetical protein
MIKEQVLTGHGEKMDEIAQQVTHVADAVACLEATTLAANTKARPRAETSP